MADAFKFKFDASKMAENLDNVLGTKAKAAMRMYAESAAQNLEAHKKDKRPWTDRTGMAKARLNGSVQEVSEGLRIALAQGVDYGIWLELANEKKYAIIQPTIQSKSGEVIEGFEGLLDKLR